MRNLLPGTLALAAALTFAFACGSARDVATGGAETNCTACHGTSTDPYPPIANPVLAAPPRSLLGATSPSDPGVGAHQRHLLGGVYSDAFVCSTCHAVPQDLAHLDGSGGVVLRGAGQRSLPADLGTFTPAGQTCAVYCHAQTGGQLPAPAWTHGPLACDDCHGQPPPSGPSSVNGYHTSISAHAGAPCASCHQGYARLANVVLSEHVDGEKDVVFPNRGGSTTALQNPGWSCTTCHTGASSGNANAPVFP